MQYIRLAEGLNKYKLIPTTENIWNHIKSNEKDYYTSIYEYNEDHYNTWKSTKTVAGIKDVFTKKLLWDFDDASNIENARQDALTLVSRLVTKGIPEGNIQVCFSGMKGFSVEIATDYKFTPEEFKNVTANLAEGLATYDNVVSDPNRVVRVVGTKHNKSGLYKFPLSVSSLSEMSVDAIKSSAASLDNLNEDVLSNWVEVKLPATITSLTASKKVDNSAVVFDDALDLSRKPKWLTDAKFALQEGFFGSGERNTAFMVLASTYKNQGFNKDIVYRMLKGVAEVQAARTGQERYLDRELWANIVNVVFNPNWKGGIYSYENTPLLREVTTRLGLKPPGSEDLPQLVTVESVTDVFKKFALDIDKNTIKLGITQVDNDVKITTSMLVGLLAAPSAGKTTVSLSVLNSLSNSNLKAIFFSLDMGAPLVYQRLIQRHTGLSGKKIFQMYKDADPRVEEFQNIVAKEYKNVRFCFKSGITTQDIKEYILKNEEREGERAKLVVVDYLECLSGPFSDSTANTALIAQQLKDIANELEICIVLLLQPQKSAGDPSAELLSYRSIKGASVIEQAASIIFTLWRPGFSPKDPANDKYMSMAVVKNRMGGLSSYDFAWSGLTGELRELSTEEAYELKDLREQKKAEQEEKSGGLF
jgi:hypothetical protein